MEALTKMTIKKTIYSTEVEADMQKITQHIADYMWKKTDPCGWATEQMFKKLKQPTPLYDDEPYDVEAWDQDVWVPKGTRYIP